MKKLNYCMLLAFIVSSCVSGCTNKSGYITGKEQFYLTPYQIEKFEKKASSGNEKAMIKLFEYYSIFGADRERGVLHPFGLCPADDAGSVRGIEGVEIRNFGQYSVYHCPASAATACGLFLLAKTMYLCFRIAERR